MSLTTTITGCRVVGDQKEVEFSTTGDSSYATGGETFAGADVDLEVELSRVEIDDNGTYGGRHDATAGTILFLNKPEGGQSVGVKDDDSAASNGVALYVHVDETLEQGTPLAHLEFVSPTNADGTGTISSGGATFYVQDDDAAATGGVALYFDEDATVADERFLANTGRDCYVMLSNGELLKVKHNATPGSAGVQVYFDEDASNSYQRLLFVSPTNANGTGYTAARVSSARAGSQVAAGTSLTGVTLTGRAYGKGSAVYADANGNI